MYRLAVKREMRWMIDFSALLLKLPRDIQTLSSKIVKNSNNVIKLHSKYLLQSLAR